jgi:hypothetical protein
MQKKGFKFWGIDESNNGRFPAVYVAACSNNVSDGRDFLKIKERQACFPKKRNHKGIEGRCSERHYYFCLLKKEENEMIPEHKRKGILIASLIYGQEIKIPIEVYADGEFKIKEKDYTIGILKNCLNIEKNMIEFYYGKDLDRKIKIVNIADELANWLFRKPLLEISKKEQLKPLLLDLL